MKFSIKCFYKFFNYKVFINYIEYKVFRNYLLIYNNYLKKLN